MNESQPVPALSHWLTLLQQQQGLLARVDDAAAIELDRLGLDIERALADLARQLGTPTGRAALSRESVKVAAIGDALKSNQAMLARRTNTNRKALGMLFGEPDLYSNPFAPR